MPWSPGKTSFNNQGPNFAVIPNLNDPHPPQPHGALSVYGLGPIGLPELFDSHGGGDKLEKQKLIIEKQHLFPAIRS
jgi:hypothetical protein